MPNLAHWPPLSRDKSRMPLLLATQRRRRRLLAYLLNVSAYLTLPPKALPQGGSSTCSGKGFSITLEGDSCKLIRLTSTLESTRSSPSTEDSGAGRHVFERLRLCMQIGIFPLITLFTTSRCEADAARWRRLSAQRCEGAGRGGGGAGPATGVTRVRTKKQKKQQYRSSKKSFDCAGVVIRSAYYRRRMRTKALCNYSAFPQRLVAAFSGSLAPAPLSPREIRHMLCPLLG